MSIDWVLKAHNAEQREGSRIFKANSFRETLVGFIRRQIEQVNDTYRSLPNIQSKPLTVEEISEFGTKVSSNKTNGPLILDCDDCGFLLVRRSVSSIERYEISFSGVDFVDPSMTTVRFRAAETEVESKLDDILRDALVPLMFSSRTIKLAKL